MEEFLIYLELGYGHITDLNGYDHILFVLALCAIYQVSDWRKVLILVTAFTVGHSITLALASLNMINYSTSLIEFLIPITIIVTCIANLFHKDLAIERLSAIRYLLALGFGLIHGMGFSSYLRSLLGKHESLLKPLFAFNVGLEVGQILIVFGGMLLTYLTLNIFKVRKATWNHIISSFIAGVAFKLMLEKWAEL